jgi:hypothetical protein
MMDTLRQDGRGKARRMLQAAPDDTCASHTD